MHLLKPWLRLFSSDNNAEWVVKSSELTYEQMIMKMMMIIMEMMILMQMMMMIVMMMMLMMDG